MGDKKFVLLESSACISHPGWWHISRLIDPNKLLKLLKQRAEVSGTDFSNEWNCCCEIKLTILPFT